MTTPLVVVVSSGWGVVDRLEAREAVRPSDLEVPLAVGGSSRSPDSSRPRRGRARSRPPGQLEVGAWAEVG